MGKHISVTNLDAKSQNLHTFSKVNLYSILAQWGKQDAVFPCPSAIIYKFYLPRAMGQAPMSSPARGILRKRTVKYQYLP